MKIVKLKRYSDIRGHLVENTDKNIMTASKHFFISKSKAGVIRGNHYHKRKSEWFYVIQGKCRIVAENIVTKKREEINIDEKDDLAVNVGPNTAHAFKNVGSDEMILLALVNEAHNQKDPDTYKYKLI